MNFLSNQFIKMDLNKDKGKNVNIWSLKNSNYRWALKDGKEKEFKEDAVIDRIYGNLYTRWCYVNEETRIQPPNGRCIFKY